MLRIMVVLLLLANLVFFVLSHDGLGPWLGLSAHNEREPQRLAAQINPQQLRLRGSDDARMAATAASSSSATSAASAPR